MTSIKDYGGEFALIDLITKKARGREVIVGIGDDAAVLKYDSRRLLLWTTDMMVESDHFNTRWSTPRQIGRKAMEANVSDIAAMGGLPKQALVSISLPDDTQIEYIEELYRGMRDVCRRYGFDIVGGNTTHGQKIVIDVSLLGLVEKNRLRLRSDARKGDLVCVTGDLGKSRAGLETLKKGLMGDVRDHLEPKCRLKEAREIGKHANAMIDVSDGLASEVNHICERSRVGAEIDKQKIPVSKNTLKLAEKLHRDARDFALQGGEDFELVFTIPEKKLRKIRIGCPVTVVGRIVDRKKGAVLLDNGRRTRLGGGFDHFRAGKN